SDKKGEGACLTNTSADISDEGVSNSLSVDNGCSCLKVSKRCCVCSGVHYHSSCSESRPCCLCRISCNKESTSDKGGVDEVLTKSAIELFSKNDSNERS